MAAAARYHLAILILIKTLSYRLFRLQLSLHKERERSCIIEGSVSFHAVALKTGQLRLLDHKISDNCSIIVRLDIHSESC